MASDWTYPDDFEDFDELDLQDSYNVITEKYFADGYEALTDAERVIYNLCLLDAEFSNGRLHQYFFNSSGLSHLNSRTSLSLNSKSILVVRIIPKPTHSLFMEFLQRDLSKI